jgi:hypothetical protein
MGYLVDSEVSTGRWSVIRTCYKERGCGLKICQPYGGWQKEIEPLTY